MAQVRGTKPKPTLLQQRAINGFREAIMGNTQKSFEQILIDAGYSENTARAQSSIMEGLKPHLQETVQWMEEHRKKVQDRMAATVDKAEYKDLVRALDTLTYNIQLLGGKPTANLALTAEDRKRLDALIED